MQLFHCSHCGFVVFFESFQCVHCGSALAFDSDAMAMLALEPAGGEAGRSGLWAQRPAPAEAPQPPGRYYRLCGHRGTHGACNFTLPSDAGDAPDQLCVSCRQTRVLPDLSVPGNQRRWTQIEAAKRWLFYTLARLGLDRLPGEQGPVYEFLADLPGAPPVMTGHAQGVITLNVAEADDDERARRRLALHEPYRTLLGHLRHECGHYFWDALVLRGGHLQVFRDVFGDERADYAEALRAHYARTPLQPADWQADHVSAYATAHPWEDWAETWAHYLHMVDLLETAASYQTAITVPHATAPQRQQVHDPFSQPRPGFDAMVHDWAPLTLLLNSLNRSLGQQDAYPFAPSPGALAKLRFVHELIASRPALA